MQNATTLTRIYTAASLLLGLPSQLGLATTTQQTGSARSNKTNFLSRGGRTGHSGRVTNVLVVTTTMRMLNGVHGHTTHLGPAVSLHLVLVVGVSGLQHGLVDTATTCNDTNHSTGVAADGLSCTRGETDTRLQTIIAVADDGGVSPTGASKSTAVSSLLLNVGDNRTLRHPVEGKHVPHGKGRVLSAVNELASVHALDRNHAFLVEFVAVGIAEGDFGDGGTTAGIVEDVLHQTFDVSMTLSIIEGTQFDGAFAFVGVGTEDAPATLPLSSDDATHFAM